MDSAKRGLVALARGRWLWPIVFAAAAVLAVAGASPSRAAPGHSGRTGALGDAAIKPAAESSSVFKLVYTGSYSYDYTNVNDQASANYTWTYAGTETLTAVPGNPSASISSGTYQMTSSGHQSDTSVAYDCTLNSGPHDTYSYATVNDGAVGNENAATPISFGWSIANPPAPANATVCTDGMTFSSLSFPIPPGGSVGSFFQDSSSALQAAISAIGSARKTIQYGQLPYTLPINIDVPAHTNSDGESGSLQLHGTLTLSVVSSPCTASDNPASAGAALATSDQAQQCCPPSEPLISVHPDGGTFNGAKPLELHVAVVRGCPPYKYHWQLTRKPKGLALNTKGGDTTAPGLKVTGKCPGALHACVGPVEFSLQVTDLHNTPSPLVYAKNNWCVPGGKRRFDVCTPQLNPRLKKVFEGQAKAYRDAALAETVRNVLEAVADATTQPGAGGIVGKAKDFWDWVQNGKNLVDQTKSDTANADKADAAVAADPPDAAVSAVALPRLVRPRRLTRCMHLSALGAAGSFSDCVALHSSLADYAQAEAQTSAVLDAVLRSQNRYGTAVRAGDAAPSALQHVVSGVLYVELGDAFAATQRAGLSMARIGRSQGLFPVLTRAKIERAARAFRRLRRLPAATVRGLPAVTRARLANALSNTLAQFHGRRLDLVATFSRSKPASLVPPKTWVTPGGVDVVVGRLVAQGDVSVASGAALSQALSDLGAAVGPAATQQALSELTIAARRVPGPAGTFLLAAERALAR